MRDFLEFVIATVLVMLVGLAASCICIGVYIAAGPLGVPAALVAFVLVVAGLAYGVEWWT